MEKILCDDQGWLRAFKKDKKEMLRDTSSDYYDRERDGGDCGKYFSTKGNLTAHKKKCVP